jgi:hypothetical protein
MKKASHPSKCLLIMVIIATFFSLTACGDSNFPKAEESVNGFFQSLSEGDLETVQSYCVSGTSDFTFTDPQEEKLVKLMFSKTEHEIVSSEEDGDTATVKVKVTNVDFEKIFEEVMAKVTEEAFDAALNAKEISEEETMEMMMKYLEESMSNQDAPVLTNEFDITLNKDSDKKIWVIQDNEDLIKNISGNMNEMFSQ